MSDSTAPPSRNKVSIPILPAGEYQVSRHYRNDYESGLVLTKTLQVGMLLLDALIFVSACLIAAYAYAYADAPRQGALPLIIIITIAASASIYWSGGYRLDMLRCLTKRACISGRACLLWLIMEIIANSVLPGGKRMQWLDLALATTGVWAALEGLHICAAGLLRTWSRAGWLKRRVVVVGLNELSREFINRLRQEPYAGVRIIGAYRTALDADQVTHAGILVRGGVANLLEHSRSETFDLVVIALPPTEVEVTRGILRTLSSCLCDVSVLSDIEPFRLQRLRLDLVGGGMNIAVSRRPLSGWHALQKSAFDRIAAFSLLIMLAPALVLIAIVIKFESKGPAFFTQLRLGRNNQKFPILKFRTMYFEFEDTLANQQTIRNDHRVTGIGRWLRRTSFDELPQLINVLLGHMSLVGPRPHALGTRIGLNNLEDVADDYITRVRVKPGMTGLAQINNCRGAIDSDEQLLLRTAYDIHYINHWSFWLDLRILCLTPIRCLFSTRAF